MVVSTLTAIASLPIPRTRLIGRDEERASARALLLEDAVPLLTLVGTGGVGKTRLALAIAADVTNAFADGVLWVDLAPLTEPSAVPGSLASALANSDQPGETALDTMIRRLRRRQTLLLLDNCEHLIETIAELAADLLEACPALQILATSRAPLQIRGEHRISVEPLPLPQSTADSLASLKQNASVELFMERARAVRPSFTLTDTNAASVVLLCRQLEGMPLAIELAAAHCAILSPAALLTQMTERAQLVSRGPRDLPARQQTITATIDWSYELLDPAVKTLLQRLSIFAGGCDLAAIAAVVNGDRFDVLKGVNALCDQGLLRPAGGPGPDRYSMLETVREYAYERLKQSGEEVAIRDRHASHFLALAETAEPMLRGAEQGTFYRQLGTEHANLRAAIRWLCQRGNAELAWRLAGALWYFWLLRGQFHEAQSILEETLALPGSTRTAAWVKAKTALGSMLIHCGDMPRARFLLEGVLPVWQELGDQRGMAWTLEELMSVALNEGDFERARKDGEDALARYQHLGDDHGVWNVLWILGVVSLKQGAYLRARAELDEALYMAGERSTEFTFAIMRSLGWLAVAEGDTGRAAEWWEKRLAAYRTSAMYSGMSSTLDDLGWLALRRQERDRAISFFTEALEVGAKTDSDWDVARSLAGLAVASARIGQFERAAWFLGAAQIAEPHGNILDDDSYHSIREAWEQAESITRAALGDARYAAIWIDAHNLQTPQIVRHALAAMAVSGAPQEKSATVSTTDHGGLTRREAEVLHLLARRQTDKEIADALFISPRTVQAHSARILGKLGVKNRREAGAAAARLGLV